MLPLSQLQLKVKSHWATYSTYTPLIITNSELNANTVKMP